MSAPNLVLQEADQLRYGVLSAKASHALRAVLDHQPLKRDDREILRQAAQFLNAVVDGVRITSTGTFRAASRPTQSMAALDIAEIAIEALRVRGSQATYFGELATAVSSAADTRLTTHRRHIVGDAIKYFEALHRTLQQRRELRRHIGRISKKSLTA